MDTLDSFPIDNSSKVIEKNDYIQDYLLESNQECFKICIKDFQKQDLSKLELECLNNCYSKYMSSFINVSYKINKKI